MSPDWHVRQDELDGNGEDHEVLLHHSRKQLDERTSSPRHLVLPFFLAAFWLLSIVIILSRSQARFDRVKRFCGQLLYCKCSIIRIAWSEMGVS